MAPNIDIATVTHGILAKLEKLLLGLIVNFLASTPPGGDGGTKQPGRGRSRFRGRRGAVPAPPPTLEQHPLQRLGRQIVQLNAVLKKFMDENAILLAQILAAHIGVHAPPLAPCTPVAAAPLRPAA